MILSNIHRRIDLHGFYWFLLAFREVKQVGLVFVLLSFYKMFVGFDGFLLI